MLQWRKIVPVRSASVRLVWVRVQCSMRVRRMEVPVASVRSRLVLMMWASSNRAPRKSTPLRFKCVCLDPMLKPRRSVSDRTRASGCGCGLPWRMARSV